MAPTAELPKVAAVVTEYRPGTHADVLLSKFVYGFPMDDGLHPARVQLAALYIDQFPAGEIGRAFAAQHGIPIFHSIQSALTLNDQRYYAADGAHPDPSGGSPARGAMADVPKLAVDGVIIIAEHGDFPWNERQARLHPRKAFLEQVCGVFAQSGRSVPVFNDKHLAPDWQESVWMVERCRELGAPFMAGSSIPLVWRKPWLEHPAGTDLLEAVCVGFSGLDIYGAHACDALQAMVERRGPTKSETGVCAVQCLQGDAVWQAASEGRFDMALAQEAVSAVESNLSEGRPISEWTYDSSTPATVFLVEYCDGFRAAVLMLSGLLSDFGYAARLADGTLMKTEMFSQRAPKYGGTGRPAEGPVAHFSYLGRNIEEMIVTGKPSYPVERTLLAGGILEAALLSRHEGGRRLPTPWLDSIAYRRKADRAPHMPDGERPSGATLNVWPPTASL